MKYLKYGIAIIGLVLLISAFYPGLFAGLFTITPSFQTGTAFSTDAQGINVIASQLDYGLNDNPIIDYHITGFAFVKSIGDNLIDPEPTYSGCGVKRCMPGNQPILTPDGREVFYVLGGSSCTYQDTWQIYQWASATGTQTATIKGIAIDNIHDQTFAGQIVGACNRVAAGNFNQYGDVSYTGAVSYTFEGGDDGGDDGGDGDVLPPPISNPDYFKIGFGLALFAYAMVRM